jgi:hypothetical protein
MVRSPGEFALAKYEDYRGEPVLLSIRSSLVNISRLGWVQVLMKTRLARLHMVAREEWLLEPAATCIEHV